LKYSILYFIIELADLIQLLAESLLFDAMHSTYLTQ